MRVEELELDPRLVSILQEDGIESLYPPQAEAIKMGLLEGENVVVSIPTASGKTLLAELAILSGILSGRGKGLYLAPLRALAAEKYNEFKRFADRFNLKIGISTGSLDSKSSWLGRYDIIVVTNEKMDSLLRHNASWLLQIGTIVADEVHLINDPSRGPTLEIVLAQLREILNSAQIVALSATIRNSRDIANWLDAKLITSEWRPVKLKEGVYFEKTIEYKDGSSVSHDPGRISPTVSLGIDAVAKGGQALLFANSRRSAVSLAKKAATVLARRLSAKQKTILSELSDSILGAGEITELSKTLADVVKSGVAFHHAGLTDAHRAKVEQAFKENLLKIIAATPTLAAGVNLPARRVVIDTLKRYDFETGMLLPIPVLEYKQQAGRAGRPKYDTEGEAISIARNYREGMEIKDTYILGDMEEITSKLSSEPALRSHILASIATELVRSEDELLQFISQTFYGYKYPLETVIPAVEQVLLFLQDNYLITNTESRLEATNFGKVVSDTYLDPLSAVIIRNGLNWAENLDPGKVTPLGILTLICSTPNMLSFPVRSTERMEYVQLATLHEEELLGEPPLDADEFAEHLGHLKIAKILLSWIDESSENDLNVQYGIQSGDLHNKVRTATWLIEAAYSIARLFETENSLPIIESLRKRIKYGVKEELLPLVSLSGIGRVRARALHRNGLRTLDDLQKASIPEIARSAGIGHALAKSIKEQLTGDTTSSVSKSADLPDEELEQIVLDASEDLLSDAAIVRDKRKRRSLDRFFE